MALQPGAMLTPTLRLDRELGHGAGLDDPNWSSLLDWMAEVLMESPYLHYRIVREAEREMFEDARLQAQRIERLPFEGEHDQLALGHVAHHCLGALPEITHRFS